MRSRGPRPSTGPGSIVTNVEALTPALEDEWESLAVRTGASPFLRPGYLAVWRGAFGGTAPELVTARRGPELVGAIAIVRRRGRVEPPGNFETPAVGIVSSDTAAEAAIVREMLSAAWREVRLDHLPDSGGLRPLLEAEAVRSGFRVVTQVGMRSPVVDTRDGWDEYWASRSRNLRHNVERCRRRADEMGGVALEVLAPGRPGDGLDALLDDVFAVEGSGWKTREGTAIVNDPTTRLYYTTLARWAASEGWLRLSFLRVGDRIAASCLSVEAHGTHYALKIGYDEGFRRISPGHLVLHGLIRRTFGTGLRRFDFAGHDEAYKLSWATSVDEHRVVTLFPRTVPGRLAHRLRRARVRAAHSPTARLLRPALATGRLVARRVGGGTRIMVPSTGADTGSFLPDHPVPLPRTGAVEDGPQTGVESPECLSTE